MVKKFRGITGIIRKAINNNELKGELRYSEIRSVLPEENKQAPDKSIKSSLYHMLKGNEIQRVHGVYFTKDASTAPAKSKSEVCVLGKLIGTQMIDGKMVANVEVTTLDYK